MGNLIIINLTINVLQQCNKVKASRTGKLPDRFPGKEAMT